MEHAGSARQVCKFYLNSVCKFGARCKFLHPHAGSVGLASVTRPSSSMFLDGWLEIQLGKPGTENIEQLSSPSGLEKLRAIADCGRQQSICFLVKLLAKPEIKYSLLKQYTNKIYVSLLETRFVRELQVYLNALSSPTADEVCPFLDVVEELQLRSRDAWKWLPLDAMKAIIDELPTNEQCSLKEEMKPRIRALLEQRRRFQLQAAVSAPDTCLQGREFQTMSIIPSKDELLLPEKEQVVPPVNRIRMRYNSALEYLETHFRLLREDFIQPLRKGVMEYRKGVGDISELRVYTNVEAVATKFTADGLQTKVKFVCPRKRGGLAIDWASSKRLMSGSLLCISRDHFGTLIWATVSRRNDVADGEVDILLVDDDELKGGVKYVMAESTAYFGAYSHVLKCLQREDMGNLPFMEHLISLERDVKPPSYLRPGDFYDFKSVFPEMDEELGRSRIQLLEEWPEWECNLDASQKIALKHAMTKRLAIIQGPPGTGKTHVGLVLVRLLLENLKNSALLSSGYSRSTRKLSGPILVVCYTNHALDQFLEGIYKFEQQLIRVGGRSRSKVLEDRNLNNLLIKSGRLDEHVRATGRARADLSVVEARRNDLVWIINSEYVVEDGLVGIATQDQIRSLFHTFNRAKDIVKVWLAGDEQSVYADEGGDEGGSWIQAKLNRTNAASDGWVVVTRGGRKREGERDAALPDWPPLEVFLNVPDVWSLSVPSRKRVHRHWLGEMHTRAKLSLERLRRDLKVAMKEDEEARNEVRLSLLRSANIVGMTTTGAAHLHDVVISLKPEIIIVEEAAEVLEAQILTSLSPYTKHLILIGDHQQLRPSVASYNLAVRHQLDVSMFERLVSAGVEHVMLQVQRRMRPCISKLISHIYPELKDHHSVSYYEDIKGMRSSLFFMDHRAREEASDELGGKVNVVEAGLVAGLCKYLLNQSCYSTTDITILAMYKGQVDEIRKRLKVALNYHAEGPTPLPERSNALSRRRDDEDPQEVHDDGPTIIPRVSSVDDFQGEESTIIILSLVRSNLIAGKHGTGTIGFLNIPNRVCVALSRARQGMYIFGNAELLSGKSPLWRKIIGTLEQDGLIGQALPLRCQNHPSIETLIQRATDFEQVGDGGCSQPCEFQLSCGHACPRRCHPAAHDGFICPKLCNKSLDGCTHRCKQVCHAGRDCPPCEEIVNKVIPSCGHECRMRCSRDPWTADCRGPCTKLLSCGHKCRAACGLPCNRDCKEEVLKQLPCGHTAKIFCYQDPSAVSCKVPCQELLDDCKHKCSGTCASCKQGRQHVPCTKRCGRDLPCGHECRASCAEPCPPCKLPCEKRCCHSICAKTCGASCRPCMERCSWSCPHFRCDLLCYEECQRPRCNVPCSVILECGHPCIGLCGELCPKKCRTCDPETLDVISQMKLGESEASDRFIELFDCEHVFEVSGLDQWMDMVDDMASGNAEAVKLKSCPECRTPIRRTFRYGNVVKRKLQQIEEVKKRTNANEHANKGVLLMRRGDYKGAFVHLRNALAILPGLMEAHLAMGFALLKLQQTEDAISHWRLIVERSSFAADVPKLDSTPRGSSTYKPLPDNVVVTTNAGPAVATEALLKWATALASSTSRNFTAAVRLCEVVLKHDRSNEEARKLKEEAEKGVFQEVVEVVSSQFGSRGHWYQCPNGHVYVVGECGGPMQTSRCPDCGATIGGQNHRAAEGNRHSGIDGSTRPLYDETTGLGNLNLDELE